MKIKIIAGKAVQISSMVWFSNIYRLINELVRMEAIIYPTKVIIMIKTTIIWSWKKMSCSIRGEALSWRLKKVHVAIGKVCF